MRINGRTKNEKNKEAGNHSPDVIGDNIHKDESKPVVMLDVDAIVHHLQHGIQHRLGKSGNERSKPNDISEVLVSTKSVKVQTNSVKKVLDNVHPRLSSAKRVELFGQRVNAVDIVDLSIKTVGLPEPDVHAKRTQKNVAHVPGHHDKLNHQPDPPETHDLKLSRRHSSPVKRDQKR